MSIQEYAWSDDDLSFDSLDIMEGEKSLWLAVRQPFRSDTVVNLEISDVKALAAHFELDADHKAALAEHKAELEKARELLKEVIEIARDNTLECFNEHMQNYGPRENMIQRNIDTSDQLHKEMNRIDEIASYLGDKS